MFKNIFVWLFVISSVFVASAQSWYCRDLSTNLPGVCTRKNQCISNREAFYVYGIKASSCDNYIDTSTCCVTPASGKSKWVKSFKKRISALTCNNNNISELSYLAAIGWYVSNGVYDFRCVGAFISPKFVLTSASCVQIKPNAVKLVISPNDVKEMSVIFVEEYIPHENFDGRTYSNDIALLKLMSPAPVEGYACLWQTDAVYTEKLTSVNIEPGLRPQIKFDNLTTSPCNNYLNQWTRYSHLRYEKEKQSKICLTSFSDWNPACSRRGSPVIAKIKKTAYIVAITSMMECLPERQTEHTRVSYYLDWIEKHVWKNYYNHNNLSRYNRYQKRNVMITIRSV